MTITQAQEAAKSWHGQAGGRMVPQLTENELAGTSFGGYSPSGFGWKLYLESH